MPLIRKTPIQISPQQLQEASKNVVIEKRKLYSSVVEALKNHNVIQAPKYLAILGINIKLSSHLIRITTNSPPDITFGMSDSMTLSRIFADKEFLTSSEMSSDNSKIQAFAEIFAGMVDARLNNKNAYKMNKSKMLDLATEGSLIIRTANTIICDHYDKIKTIDPFMLFCFGKTIAFAAKVSLIKIPITDDVTKISQIIHNNIESRKGQIINRIDSFASMLGNKKQQIDIPITSLPSTSFRNKEMQRRENNKHKLSNGVS